MEDEPGVIMVRGRVKSDLERLQQLLVTLGHEPPEILEWENRDYRYRCLVGREVWAEALGRLAGEIGYLNFKARMAEVQDAETGTRVLEAVAHHANTHRPRRRAMSLPATNAGDHEFAPCTALPQTENRQSPPSHDR